MKMPPIRQVPLNPITVATSLARSRLARLGLATSLPRSRLARLELVINRRLVWNHLGRLVSNHLALLELDINRLLVSLLRRHESKAKRGRERRTR